MPYNEQRKTIPHCIPLSELSKRLHKSTRSVRRMCKKGLIPGAFQIGKAWFIREDSPVFPEYPQEKKKEYKNEHEIIMAVLNGD